MNIKLIRTEEDYAAAMARIDELWGAEIGTSEGDELDVLAVLIEKYEDEHCPMPMDGSLRESAGASLYPVVLFAGDEQHAWGVEVPDVPGCFSAGETMAEALENVREALELHFEGLVADGEPLPQPQEVDAHVANPDYAGGVWALVDFDVTPYLGKAVRFNGTLPEHLRQRSASM